jgi:hypothetical protein
MRCGPPVAWRRFRIIRPHRLQAFYLGRNPEAGDGNRTRMTSLEDRCWSTGHDMPLHTPRPRIADDPWLTVSDWELPIGIEPMTYALREACSRPPHALAAPIAPVIALTTPAALGLSDDSVHEPVHSSRPN